MMPNVQIEEIDTAKAGLGIRIKRRMARYRHKRMITPKLQQPIISFTFDDCPKSVVDHALPLLEKEKWRSTIYMACGLWGKTNHLGLHMTAADTKAAYHSGHEIADHTFSHLDCLTVSERTFLSDIDRNQAELDRLGIPRSRNFAYPYGQVSPGIKQHMLAQFETSRGIHTQSELSLDTGLLPSTRLYSGPDIMTAKNRLADLSSSPRWDVFFTHDVRDNPSRYGCTPEDFKAIIAAVKHSNAIVLPVAEALDFIRSQL